MVIRFAISRGSRLLSLPCLSPAALQHQVRRQLINVITWYAPLTDSDQPAIVVADSNYGPTLASLCIQLSGVSLTSCSGFPSETDSAAIDLPVTFIRQRSSSDEKVVAI